MTDPTPSASIEPAERTFTLDEIAQAFAACGLRDSEFENIAMELEAMPVGPQGGAEPRIDPMQNPKRPTYMRLGPADEHPAEQVLRKLACWLGVGGYNAPTVDAGVFHDKIIWGIEHITKVAASPAALVEQPNDWQLLKFMNELHSHLPEDKRPMSMSDFSDEQVERIRRAFATLGELPAVAAPQPLTDAQIRLIASRAMREHRPAGDYEIAIARAVEAALASQGAPAAEQPTGKRDG